MDLFKLATTLQQLIFRTLSRIIPFGYLSYLVIVEGKHDLLSKTRVITLVGVMAILFISCQKEDEKNIPLLTTTEVTEITKTTATTGGCIIDEGGATITARGVCWSTSPNPTINDSKTQDGAGGGNFSSSINGLEPNTTYFVMAYATNSAGTGYGTQISFSTSMPDGPGGTITDIDGNIYNTIWINGRQWMKENLKTTHYNNGTSIPNITTDFEWSYLTSGAYAWYDNMHTYKEKNGALYNWFAVNTGNLCPTGWHVPADQEWTALIDYIGDATIACSKLKATSGWEFNYSGTDEYGFSALPGGYRDYYTGYFKGVNTLGTWWSSTSKSEWRAFNRTFLGTMITRGGHFKECGYSVRCIRNK